jgi:hypothetical protein
MRMGGMGRLRMGGRLGGRCDGEAREYACMCIYF